MAPSWRNGIAIGVDDTRLFYETCSKGVPLVLCDGLFCNGHVWKYFISRFCDTNQLIHWHYPGHGKSASPKSTADLSIRRLGQDLCRVLDAVQLDSAVLVGHSLGVQVSLETAYRFPDRVNGLILICGAPGKVVQTFHDSRLMEAILPLLGMGTRFVPRQLSSLWRIMPVNLIVNLVKQSDEIARRLINMEDLKPYFEGMVQTDINIATRILEQANYHDMLPNLHEIVAPTLVIAGNKDRFTPSYRSREMAEKLPNAVLRISEEGTHSLPLEQPDLVNLAIARFLEELQIDQRL
ncbi:MAG: alpha/beta hydrolase [Deltaproteobacteria bacterium]|nr:alpha/beta hydrolase [Deltaproteobacteria bacterium]